MHCAENLLVPFTLSILTQHRLVTAGQEAIACAVTASCSKNRTAAVLRVPFRVDFENYCQRHDCFECFDEMKHGFNIVHSLNVLQFNHKKAAKYRRPQIENSVSGHLKYSVKFSTTLLGSGVGRFSDFAQRRFIYSGSDVM